MKKQLILFSLLMMSVPLWAGDDTSTVGTIWNQENNKAVLAPDITGGVDFNNQTVYNLAVAGGGILIQSVYKHYTASVSGSGDVTRTDNPVLGDETVLFMDITITPTSAENKIFVEAVGSLNVDNVGSITLVAGIFINNTALRVQESAIDNGRFTRTVPVFYSYSALTTDPITYQYRVGTIGGMVAYMNSLYGSAEIYGNTLPSYIRAWEETR